MFILLVDDIIISVGGKPPIRPMAAAEIIPGIYVVRGKFASEFGFIASYLVVDEGEVLVIDPGTAGDPGNRLEKAIKELGLDPKTNIVGIICTHGHPDHAAGAGRLKKSTGASIMIHRGDAELLETPAKFLNERLMMDKAERFSMKFDKGPLRVNYRGIDGYEILSHGQNIGVGETTLKVIHTSGHSAGHCSFYDTKRNALFSGDELNNFPNDPRKFYVDKTGSIVAKLAAIDVMSKLGAEHIFPSHDTPHLFADARLQFEAVKDGVVHLQDTILTLLSARGDADIEQFVFDIKQARSIPIPQSYEALLTTTIHVTLVGLKEAGLVRDLGNGIWTRV
ncbi:MAG: MBL fold metallo-hydrolase [Candidatus Thorarchaeota archaeon]